MKSSRAWTEHRPGIGMSDYSLALDPEDLEALERDIFEVVQRYAGKQGSERVDLHALILPGAHDSAYAVLAAGRRCAGCRRDSSSRSSALLPLERGLTIAEYGAVAATQGFVVLLLELPTGGFADALGRKPVFIASAAVALASYVIYALAQVPLVFVLASALSGIFRALDSGPLNAWFVDAVHEDEAITNRSNIVARGLSGYASVVGASIAIGAVISGLFILWAPLGRENSLALPFWIAAGLAMLQIVVAS